MKIRQSACIGVILFSIATGAHAVIEAGRVQFVFGVAHAIGGEGGQRQLAKAEPVYAGETIVTGPTASLQLRMIDKAVLAIRPNSQVHIETYHLADTSGQAILRLVQGSLRSVTGLIGQLHSDKYRIITNRAYLGVRGTDHEPSHILPGAADGAEPGTYDKVNTGATFLAGPGGRIDLDPNEVGFAGNLPGAGPVRLEGVPAFMRPTPAIADGGLSGEAHPGRVQAPAGTEPRIALRDAEPGVVTQKQTADGSVDFTAGTFAAGAPRVAGVYGDMTGAQMRNGAFIAVKNPAEKFFAGKAQSLSATDPDSKLSYHRGTVSAVATGSGSFVDDGTTVVVNWGIYGTGSPVNGHTIKDQYSAGSGRQPSYAHLMAALETPAPVLATLSGTYSNIVASTPIIAESDAPGGSLTSATIVLANGKLTQYDIAATDLHNRNWTGSCPTCAAGVSLANFRDSGIALSGTGPTGGAASGKANGQAVGPTGKGIVSSFALQEGTAAITGSFAVTK